MGDMRAAYTPGNDDYYSNPFPQNNVVSPAPQRVNPGVPGQIQTNLAKLDLNGTETPSSAQRPGAHPQSPQQVRPVQYTPSVYSSSSTTTTPQLPPTPQSQRPGQQQPNLSGGIPSLPFRTDNVPESADDRGLRLERDRVAILSSSNFEDQIGWATDALNYIDVSAEQDRRLTPIQRPRSNTPTSEKQLKQDALGIVSHMAVQDHPRALFLQGMWYEFGKFGYAEDKRQAFNCFSKAASVGYPRAEYRIGMQFEATGNPSTALQHFRAGEAAGDSACCYRMGMVYALGQLGQPQDQARAVQLIRYAADTADDNAPQGAYVFGMLQAKDLPQIDIPDHLLPQDLDAAKYYVERSALLGFCKAQLKMGSAYEVASLHCEFNPLLSMHYNALAARQGEPEAEMALSKWFMIGHEGVCQINHELSYKYAQRAALSGLPAAEFAMGYFHEIGWFVNKDVANAKAWYEKAAKDGSKEAADGLRRLNSSGALSMQDHNNIAVTRIKSVHGSQRGNRPPRLKQRPTNRLPPISDEAVRATPPPRSTSAAPYPTDDHPGRGAALYPDNRTQMPGQMPPPGSYGSSNPETGYGHPPGSGRGQPPPGARPPYGSLGPQHQYGHGTPPPTATYNQGAPPPLRHLQSTGDVNAGHNYGHPPHRVGSMPNQPGYGAPAGSYPPRPPKEPVQHGPPPGVQRPPYSTPPPNQMGRPPMAPGARPGFDPRPSQPPITGTPGPQAPGMLRPGSTPGSRPSSSHGHAAAKPQGRTSPASGQAHAPPPSQNNAPPTSRPQPQQRPPGTGPKTFDQMGIPNSKNDSECSVM